MSAGPTVYGAHLFYILIATGLFNSQIKKTFYPASAVGKILIDPP
jgi:hypothetical protein